MKKAILLTAFIIFTGLNGLVAQHTRIIPIPCFNHHLTMQSTTFQERVSFGTPKPPHREKRDMEISISSSSTSPVLIYATVWVVKAQGSVVLGPFTVYPEDLLSVPIDNDQWGVVIGCNWNVTASVWIE